MVFIRHILRGQKTGIRDEDKQQEDLIENRSNGTSIFQNAMIGNQDCPVPLNVICLFYDSSVRFVLFPDHRQHATHQISKDVTVHFFLWIELDIHKPTMRFLDKTHSHKVLESVLAISWALTNHRTTRRQCQNACLQHAKQPSSTM
jgi:hypothetical protein